MELSFTDGSPEATHTRKNLRPLQASIYMEKALGEELERGQILFTKMSATKK